MASHLPNIRDLEAARYKPLENALRVVLSGSRFHLLDVFRPIPSQRILGHICIIEIYVRVVGADAFGISTYFVKKLCTGLLEELILCRSLPGDIWLVH